MGLKDKVIQILNNMKSWECWIVYILLFIALILSIISICRTCPRTDLGFDYMGVIVGLLALLVGFLVAWQIYKTIDIEKKVDLISNGSKDAIAEDMFYSAYSRVRAATPNHIEILNSSVKTCVAALNLNFSEEKAKLLFEVVKSFGGYYKKEKEIDEMINDLENIKYNSKSIHSCIDYLEKRKSEEHDRVTVKEKQNEQ